MKKTDCYSMDSCSKQRRRLSEVVAQRCSVKKGFLEISQNAEENTCLRLRPAALLKKETLTQLFSCEFCGISENTFFTEHLWATAFRLQQISQICSSVYIVDSVQVFVSGILENIYRY